MTTTRWAWITAAAVLFSGLTNAHAHVHYCFDGQEPPAAVHLTDGIDHAHEHPSYEGADGEQLHDDLDVDVPNEALAKIVKHDQLALAPQPGWITPRETQRRAALAPHSDTPPAPDPAYARPQLRAPPR